MGVLIDAKDRFQQKRARDNQRARVDARLAFDFDVGCFEREMEKFSSSAKSFDDYVKELEDE